MGLSTEVPDGATQRHSRTIELLTFINLNEPRGATITQIQSHTLTVFGLKLKTTTKMVRELALTGSCDLSAVPVLQRGFKPHMGLRRVQPIYKGGLGSAESNTPDTSKHDQRIPTKPLKNIANIPYDRQIRVHRQSGPEKFRV